MGHGQKQWAYAQTHADGQQRQYGGGGNNVPAKVPARQSLVRGVVHESNSLSADCGCFWGAMLVHGVHESCRQLYLLATFEPGLQPALDHGCVQRRGKTLCRPRAGAQPRGSDDGGSVDDAGQQSLPFLL